MVNVMGNVSNLICLVGGGVVYAEDIAIAARLTTRFVGVDGGANTLVNAGHMPEAVIGDMDSLTETTRDLLPSQVLQQIDEQDTTDFEKALMRVEASLILAVGFTGGRIDHELAALHALVRFEHRPCVLLADHEVIFHCPPDFNVALGAGEIVSLFPILPVQGTSTGLEWPIDGLKLAPGRRVGTSNRAIGGEVRLIVDGPGLLVILPRERLSDVMTAMQDCVPAPAPSPAP